MGTEPGEHTLEELIDELARVFHDSGEARELALRAGFSPAEVPSFDNTPGVFWARVVRAANDGKTVGGVKAIVGQAKAKFPGNQFFAAYASSMATVSIPREPPPGQSGVAPGAEREPLAHAGWWETGGVPLAVGTLLVAAGPSIVATIWATPLASPLLWAALWTVGTGLVLLGGVMRWVDSQPFELRRRPTGLGPLFEWLRLTIHDGLFDASPSERRARWGLVITTFSVTWIVAYGAALGASTANQIGPHVVGAVAALGIGALSIALALSRMRGRWASILLLTVLAGRVLPNLVMSWVEFGEIGSALGVTLFQAPAGYTRTAWLLIGPTSSPLLLVGAVLSATMIAQVTGQWAARRLVMLGIGCSIISLIGLFIRGGSPAS